MATFSFYHHALNEINGVLKHGHEASVLPGNPLSMPDPADLAVDEADRGDHKLLSGVSLTKAERGVGRPGFPTPSPTSNV